MARTTSSTSERVADILGMSDAHTILRALDEGGEPAHVARATIKGMDDQMQLKFALVQMCHAIDRTEEKRSDDRKEFDALNEAHNQAMSGQGQSCRFISDLETKFMRYLIAAFVVPILLWGITEFLAWRLKSYAQPAKQEVQRDARSQTGTP